MLTRGGKMKVWSVLIVVAAWVWWYAEINTPASLWPSIVVEEQQTLDYNYTTVRFTTKEATEEKYSQFIKKLRGHLTSTKMPHRIPVTREPSTVLPSERFVLVELSNSESDSPVTLAIHVTNVYVIAYRTGNRSFFFNESNPDPAISNLFPRTSRYNFSFSSNYGDLERVAGKGREKINLGGMQLEDAICKLQRSETEGDQGPLALSLIVIIQMVAEPVRFKTIEHRVRQSIPRDSAAFQPGDDILSRENNWRRLSAVVQESQRGAFSSEVQLPSTVLTNVSLDVGSVRDAVQIASLALMLFVCRQSQRASTNHDYFIDDDTCVEPEPTVRISGLNGLCVDVMDGQYNNENPIQLWPCKEHSDAGQMWTFKKDGTIRSNGKCLTTYGYTPGNYIMIYDCPTPVTAATIWQVWDNGTIINPQSALVLSANCGDSGTILTVETNTYASRQAWRAGNNTKPAVAVIVGLNDLCMQANGDAMWVEECASGKEEQKWVFYADGTIRPLQNQDCCLTSADNQCQGSIIIISSCYAGSEDQRWVFTNDGTILNLANGMVMDVRGSDPSLKQIIIWPFTGNPNQLWLPVF